MHSGEQAKIVFEESKLLRSEMHLFFSLQYTVLGFGITIISALSTFCASNLDQTDLCSLILGIIVPIISITVLYIWIGSVEKAIRISYYLKHREEYFNRLLNINSHTNWLEKPVAWEHWVREFRQNNRSRIFFKDYIGIIAFFLGSALTSSIIAYHFIVDSAFSAYAHSYIVFSLLLVSGSTVSFYFYSKQIINEYGE